MNTFAYPIAVDDVVDTPRRPTMSAESPRIFVVPAFNEAENLPRLLDDLDRRVQLMTPGSRLIIVDDGSADDTAAVAAAHRGCVPIDVVELGVNQGPGAAFRAGFATALRDCPEDAYIVTLEADTTSDLDALPAMIDKASRGAEVVLASVHGGGRMVNVSLLRRVLSRAAGHVVRLALGLDAYTVSSFYRVYRASTLRRALAYYGDDLIEERGFACKAEILAKLVRIGATVEEVPIDLDGSKRIGESKMSIVPTLAGYARLMARERSSRESDR